jgi:hypothetical protein
MKPGRQEQWGLLKKMAATRPDGRHKSSSGING